MVMVNPKTNYGNANQKEPEIIEPEVFFPYFFVK